MRGGGGVVCSLQQSLTAEAGTTVKQAISLARRRGHAQVTPIHVASVMLVSPAAAVGLLRTACLKSHSHPLQCKVLELCFNVALNRLPTMTPPYYNSISPPGTTTHHHDNYHSYHECPSLSNALVAAFKRAQAHQRRGASSDQQQQQQSILTVKIEAEQLVISILDDPSVSRVMREAGFSSTLIKSNVVALAAVSLQQAKSQSPPPPPPPPPPSLPPPSSMINNIIAAPSFSFKPSSTTVSVRKEDVSSVFESLVSQTTTTKKKKNTIIVGESLADCEGVVRAVKERIERGGADVPLELRHVQFLSLPIFSIMSSKSREEVDLRLGEVRFLLERSNGFVGGGGAVGRGIVLYLGDLKWLSEFWGYYKSHGTDDRQKSRPNYINDYGPLEHMIMGLRSLVFGCNYNNGGRLWLMGIATFSSYIKCKSSGQKPSLETLLDLHPLTIPVGALELSLNLSLLLDRSSSDHEGDSKNNIILLDEEKENCDWGTSNNDSKFDTKLTCCTDCSANFHREARSLSNSSTPTTNISSSLPSWLQKCIKKETKDDNSTNIDQDDGVSIKELCKKWNSFCSSTHNGTTANYLGVLGKVVNFSGGSSSPSSPTFISSSYDQRCNSLACSAFDPAKWPSKARNIKHQVFPFMSEQKPDLLSNPSSTPNSASSSEETQEPIADKPPFVCSHDRGLFEQGYNTDNLTALCLALEKRVPWQKDVIPDIANTVLKCRAGLMVGNHSYRAARRGAARKQETTWFSFLGADDEGKVEIAKELAKLVFGSQSNFKRISFMSSNFASAASGRAADSTDHHEFRNKRGRDHEAEGGGRSYLERFAVEIKDNPHRVFYVEDAEQVDQFSQKGIKRAIETGEILLPYHGGEVIPLKDAVVILSCDSLNPTSRAFSPPIKQRVDKSDDEEEAAARRGGACLQLDLNIVDDREIGLAADEHSFYGDVRILEAVDMQVFFKIQGL